MLFGALEKKTQPGGIIGIDLGERFTQVSYWLPGAETPTTLSQTSGETDYMIPTVVLRRNDRDVWTYGRDALKLAAVGEGTAVRGLIRGAMAGTTVTVEGGIYETEALLALFVKRIFSLLSSLIKPEKANLIVFTVDHMDREFPALIRRVMDRLSLSGERVVCIDRAESFFYYNMNQPIQLWRHSAVVCDFDGGCMRLMRLQAQTGDGLRSAMVEERELPLLKRPEGLINEEQAEELDRNFAETMENYLQEFVVDTVYLIGTGFDGDWYQESIEVLCRGGRRVYRGSNLYSKGACYGGRSLAQAMGRGEGFSSGTDKDYLYLGTDMIKADAWLVGTSGGKDYNLELLKGGTKWYDASCVCEFLPGEDMSFVIRVNPLQGRQTRDVIVTLDGIPERPPRTTRLRMKCSCTGPDKVRLLVEDLGFGEFFPATHKQWEEEFEL